MSRDCAAAVSTLICSMISRRQFARTTAVAFMLAPRIRAMAAEEPLFRPEDFGAVGNGMTDDSAAFARLSDAVNAAGGGRVVLQPRTYLVGTQQLGADGPWMPVRVMEFLGCRKALRIDGNGARLRCAQGQRYGLFTLDGAPAADKSKGPDVKIARPYRWMVLVQNCTGPVAIADLELDGNMDAHVLGGRHGDRGWQIGCVGIGLRDNLGSETLTNIRSDRHALDGFYIDGPDQPTPGAKRQLQRLMADANARQGMSIVGGRDYELVGCSFTRTGRGKFASAPSAGVDIEAEHKKTIRNLRFVDCSFLDNKGVGFLADAGDSADVRCERCTIIGTTNWSAWPKKPGFVFESCLFIGSLVHAYGDPDARRAARFVRCRFTDDPALSPTKSVVLRKSLSADLSGALNVLFDRCSFRMVAAGVLPWSSGQTIYKDCTMSQVSQEVAHTRGVFRGLNRIVGAVAIGNSTVAGTLILNGKRVPRRLAGPTAAANDGSYPKGANL